MHKNWRLFIAAGVVFGGAWLVTVTKSWAHVGGPRVLEGRMTGGGSIFTDENDLWAPTGTRLTHGFELHCDPLDQPNNLEVEVHLPNGEGGRFHLDELTFAWCWDDPDIDPKPPNAPFDSYFGTGTGRYNGVPGYCADWEFTDAGEPGTNDRIRSMRIWKPQDVGNCSHEEEFLFSIYLEPGHTLTYGNHQAHRDNK
jgi:hypothetical protein